MSCRPYRDAVSARIDGEDPGVGAEALERHLARCTSCRAWQRAAQDLTRSARVGPAEAVPDLTAPILAAVGAERGAAAAAGEPTGKALAWRVALVAVALAQLALALPQLVFGSDAGIATHAARELGSFDVALAVGLAFAAWRPARAWGLLPCVAALAACLLAATGIDLAEGRAAAVGEFHHALDLAGLWCLWVLARGQGRPTAAAAPRLACGGPSPPSASSQWRSSAGRRRRAPTPRSCPPSRRAGRRSARRHAR